MKSESRIRTNRTQLGSMASLVLGGALACVVACSKKDGGNAQAQGGPSANPQSAAAGSAKAGGAACGNRVVETGEHCDHESGNNYLADDCGDIWGGSTGVNGSENDCSLITPADCSFCEKATDCAELTDPLARLLATKAEQGPAAGQTRFALYNEVLDCIRDTKCAANTGLDCYCGDAAEADCDAGKGDGKCRAQIERGLETTDPREVTNRFTNVAFGGGLALARISCDRLYCPEQCF
jgi:hypothetical protein